MLEPSGPNFAPHPNYLQAVPLKATPVLLPVDLITVAGIQLEIPGCTGPIEAVLVTS